MRTGVVALLAALAGGAAGGALVATVVDGDTTTVVRQAPIERATEDEPGGLSAAAIYRRDSAGVVFIRADVVRQTTSPYDLGQIEQRGTTTGTGFVIDREGTIVTNAHVV